MKNRDKIYTWISIIYIIITGGFNLFGYFNLPAVIATQISSSGGQVNHMSTPIYLIATFLLVTLLSIFCIINYRQQKLKHLLINTIMVVANIVMIGIQL